MALNSTDVCLYPLGCGGGGWGFSLAIRCSNGRLEVEIDIMIDIGHIVGILGSLSSVWLVCITGFVVKFRLG